MMAFLQTPYRKNTNYYNGFKQSIYQAREEIIPNDRVLIRVEEIDGQALFVISPETSRSFIKRSKVNKKALIIDDNSTLVGDLGEVCSIYGRLHATLILGDQKVNHNLIIIPDDFPISADGIFGADLLQYDSVHYFSENEKIQFGKTVVKCTNKQTSKLQDSPHLKFYVPQIGLSRAEKIYKKLCVDGMSQEYQKIMAKVSDIFNLTFFLDRDKLTVTNAVKYKIRIPPETKPIHLPPYHLPRLNKEELNIAIEKFYEQGIIRKRKYNSLWSFPLNFSMKNKNKPRLVIDFRELNNLMKDDPCILPNIFYYADRLANAKYFSIVDLQTASYQIELQESDKPKTAFRTHDEIFEFNRMPMGFKDGTATIQRLMNTVLGGLEGVYCYVDDIMIHSSTLEVHESRLFEVLKRLRGSQLKLKTEKCQILREQVIFLGFELSSSGVKPEESKIQIIINWESPQSVRNVKSFYNLTRNFQQFIPNYDFVAWPLFTLIQNGVFEWEETHIIAFQALKEAFKSLSPLQYPKFKDTFVVSVEIYDQCFGMKLSQNSSPIRFNSQKWKNAEEKYDASDKWIQAILYAMKCFISCLSNNNVFDIIMYPEFDTEKFSQVDSSSTSLWCTPTGILNNYRVVDENGVVKENINNVLHKILKPILKDADNIKNEFPKAWPTPAREFISKKKGDVNSSVLLKSNYSEDLISKPPTLQVPLILNDVNDKDVNDKDVNDDQKVRAKQFVTSEQKTRILLKWHDSPLGGHNAHVKSSVHRISFDINWEGIEQDVEKYIEACETCQQKKNDAINSAIQMLDRPQHKLEKCALGIFGPLKKTDRDNEYLMVLHDNATMYGWAIPLQNCKIDSVLEAYVELLIVQMGYMLPKIILVDENNDFKSEEKFQQLCKNLNITILGTPSNNVNCDGVLQRLNTILQEYFNIYDKKGNEWDKFIKQALLYSNTTPYITTGITPFKQFFTREAM